jgi:hypothetical protein
MLDTLKMILRSAKERGQTSDEGVLRVRPPRRERVEMRFLDWSEASNSRRRRSSRTATSSASRASRGCGRASCSPCAIGRSTSRGTVAVEAGARDGKLVRTKTAAAAPGSPFR